MGTITFNFCAPSDAHREHTNKAVLVEASSSRDEGEWKNIRHSHYFTELIYVKDGKGDFLMDDSLYPITKDQLILINPHVNHTEFSSEKSPLSYYTVGIDGIGFSFPDRKNFRILNCKNKYPDFHFYFYSLLHELSQKADGYEEVCQHMLECLVIQLHRITGSVMAITSSRQPSSECEMIRNYLDSNYNEEITLDTLSRLSHLNKYYLTHKFTNYYGVPPIQYLNNRRIEICKNLLENTDYRISDIARLSGFSSQSYFSQSFQKACGMSALAYRKLHKKAPKTE